MKNQKGITLIALVITIIILLILAAISINALTGENGLMVRAKQAKQNTIDSANKENSILSEMEGKIAEGLNEKINVGKEKLTIENRKIVSSESKVEFKMKGIAIAQVFTYNENRASANTLQLLKKDGFNAIRYQLSADMFYNFNTSNWREDGIVKIKDFCQRAEDAGIYVIVDMHALKSGQLGFYDRTKHTYCMVSEDGIAYKDEYLLIWERLAEELKGYKSVLAYEIMNEPSAAWHDSQEKTLENYSSLMQECIDKIRTKDKDTIVSFQPILNYIDNDSYSWTAATVSKVPNVNGDDLLYDSYHSYDRTLFQQPYGVLNCSTAYGAKESASKSQKGTQYTSIQSSSSTYSTIIEAGDLAKKLNWAGIRIKNASGSKVSADNYKIYKINDDGTESEVLNLKSTDDSRKINVYNLSNKLAKEITVPSDSYLYLANAFFTSIPIRIIAT